MKDGKQKGRADGQRKRDKKTLEEGKGGLNNGKKKGTRRNRTKYIYYRRQ